MVDLSQIALEQHAAVLQQELDRLKQALEDPNIPIENAETSY